MSPRLTLAGLVALGLAMVGLAQITGDAAGEGSTALGEAVVVEYAPVSASGARTAATKLAVTVTAVRRGTRDELRQGGLEFGADDRTATPYYVDARFVNRGGRAVDRDGLIVSLEDEDGESLRPALILGLTEKRYEPCPEAADGMLDPGATHESCTLVLVAEGRDPANAVFVSQDAGGAIAISRWKVPGR